MITRAFFYATIIVFTGLLFLSISALAEKPGDQGGGSDTIPPDYGDIYILYRDTNGIPVLTEAIHEDENDPTSTIIEGLCLQPILSQQFYSDNPDALDFCLQTDSAITEEDPQCLAEVDPVTCAPRPDYGRYLQEVDFGRINLARSPEEVFQAQVEEAVFNLTTAGCISLDPAGRMVYSSLIDGVVVSHTIDSPLQNLAIFRKLMQDGKFHDLINVGADWLTTAARSLGAASDKEGEVTVDLVAYMNMIFGFTDDDPPSALDRICLDVRQEVKGEILVVEKCYLDYHSYSYSRDTNFNLLPTPPYIPSEYPENGTFEYMRVINSVPYTTEQTIDKILNVVPELASTWFGPNIKAFAKSADDTRAVIEFMHTFEVAEEYSTSLQCNSEPSVYYDVSISEQSGLQVPSRMVAGTEGREGVVTIDNAGPAAATGLVRLVGMDANDTIVAPLYRMVDGTVTDETIFNQGDNNAEVFEIASGFSQSWTFFFSMDYPTTINWTAEVIAAEDVNENNNEVTAETIVTETKGGGGH